MSCLMLKIVDAPSDEAVEIEDLTHTGLGILISDCEELLEKLKEAALNYEED